MSKSPTGIRSKTASAQAHDEAHEDRIIAQAIALLERRLFATGPWLANAGTAYTYLRLTLMQEPAEVFAAVFLDAQNRVIACETLFRGTLESVNVHPRVIIQRTLVHNASALIVAHQHPSGHTSPSARDMKLTRHLKSALKYVDVHLLDHLIIGKNEPFSFAENGLL